MINLGKYGRLLKCATIVVCFCLFFYYIINSGRAKEQTKQTKQTKQKTILYWTPMFKNLNFGLGLGDEIFQYCEYRNCYTTYNRTYLPIVGDYDALLFHGAEPINDIPKQRKHEQIYIVAISESPIYSNYYLKNFNNFFNWTMTYRSDSDIIRPYGIVKKQKTNYQLPEMGAIQMRTKQIGWFVSHCQTDSLRERIVVELQKSLNIDIYGVCGNMSCPRDSQQDCMKQLERDYKFYLAFENSYCRDYVTEKLYNTLKYDLIPIVYGGGDYERITPPHSVINLANYQTLDDFIDYIRYLDQHPEEYLKYFEWKRDYIVDTSEMSALCSLCRQLNQPIRKKKSYRITDWWYNKDICTFPDNINNFINK